MRVLEYQVFVFIAIWMGSAINIIVAGIPTAKPGRIARDTERDSQRSGREGVRKNKFTLWWGRRWSQECVWTWPLFCKWSVVWKLTVPTLYIFMRFRYYRLGLLIFSSGRYGSTGRDPFSSEYHLTLETSPSEKFKFPCENINWLAFT